ncbi:hypothetical protein [Crocosphaera chwakensis]|nr:hypothetical protein [Crocosphaera chwakensis]
MYTSKIETLLVKALKRFIDSLHNDLPMSEEEYQVILEDIKNIENSQPN